MNYRRMSLEARQKRDAAVRAAQARASRAVVEARAARGAEIERARAEAREALRLARAARRAEILRLRSLSPPLSIAAIAVRVGCNKEQVVAVLDPQRHAAYNRRRLNHWRARAAEKVAA
jgi:uncharacterized membrane protein YqiK